MGRGNLSYTRVPPRLRGSQDVELSLLNPEQALVKSGGTLWGSWNKEARFKRPV